MPMNHLTGLNPSQREAVEYIDGPLLVLAGAGSGKTRVITHRILHLISTGVPPHHILAVTFTNKTAREMRERVQELMRTYPETRANALESLPTVSTFHALGVRIIREHHDACNVRKHFAIYDRSDSIRAIKSALEKAGYSPKQFEPRRMLGIISRAKGDALTRLAFQDSTTSYPEEVAAHVWEHYEAILHKEQALDFDDLLIRVLVLFRDHPEILRIYQERFQYIHVDEYQDTNKVQFEIVRELSREHENVCAVGDVDQNIYSWRGADISNIMQFEKHFRNAKTVFLEENYRSTKTIVAVSNAVIEKNTQRLPKTAFTNNHDGEHIGLYAAYNESDEAQFVANTVGDLIKRGAQAQDIAVLFRTNFQSRALEEACIDQAIPYQMLGTRFFDRREVKDVMAYLRLARNPDGVADLSRIINVPTRGIGKVTLMKLVEGKRGDIQGATLKKVAAFEEMMMDISKKASVSTPSETIKYIMHRSGIEAACKNDGEEGLERLENLRELVTIASKYDEFPIDEAVERLLEDVALQTDQDTIDDAKNQANSIKLMTVHAAKGLEFPYIFITGLEEGLFPHERLSDDGIDMEEERRLFYVALTRAGKKAFLSYAHMRTIFGARRMNVPSSFLEDIDPSFVEILNPTSPHEGGETVVYLD